MNIEVNGDLVANVSSMPMAELIANISTDRMDGNEVNRTNISGSSRVEVYEDQDVMLTFVMEAYPPIRNQHWTTPTNVNNDNKTVYVESYVANGYRLVLSDIYCRLDRDLLHQQYHLKVC